MNNRNMQIVSLSDLNKHKREGIILKDKDNNLIGCLKETRKFTQALAKISDNFNQETKPSEKTEQSFIDLVDQSHNNAVLSSLHLKEKIQSDDITVTPDDIKVTSAFIDKLQTIGSGLIDSSLSFGVSTGGFSVVLSKLSQIQNSLDSIKDDLADIKKEITEIKQDIAEIKQIVQRTEIKFDYLVSTKLNAAINELTLAETATITENKIKRAHKAEEMFRELKHYYAPQVIEYRDLWNDPSVDFNEVESLYSKLLLATIGELHAAFYSNDIYIYKKALNINIDLISSIGIFDKKHCYRNRLSLFDNAQQLAKYIKNKYDSIYEGIAILKTMSVECNYLEHNEIAPLSYLQELSEFEKLEPIENEPGLILIPYHQ
jgi:archaellum component FlaC